MINGRAFSFSRGRPTRFTDIYETAVWCSSNPSGNNDRSTRFLPSTFHDWSRNRLISNYCVEDGNARISLAITLAEIGREKRGLLDQRWLDESLVNSPSLNPLFPDRRSNRCAWARRTEPHSRATDDSRFVSIIRIVLGSIIEWNVWRITWFCLGANDSRWRWSNELYWKVGFHNRLRKVRVVIANGKF